MMYPHFFSENATNFAGKNPLISGNADMPLIRDDNAADKTADNAADNEPTRTILSDLLGLARLLIWANNCAPQNPS